MNALYFLAAALGIGVFLYFFFWKKLSFQAPCQCHPATDFPTVSAREEDICDDCPAVENQEKKTNVMASGGMSTQKE